MINLEELIIKDNTKFKYDKNSNSLTILDFRSSVIKLLFIPMSVTSVIFVFQFITSSKILITNYIQLFIAVCSFFIIGYYLKNKSNKKTILISDINSLTEKNSLDRKKLFLKLKNGKERDLSNFNNIEIEKVKRYLNDIGIK